MQEFWLTIKKNVCLASTGVEKAQEKKKKSMAQRQDLAVWVYLTLLSQKKKKS